MNDAARTLPPAAQYVLTHKLPCAVLAALMFTAVLWVPGMVKGLPLLAAMLPIFALGLQVLTPALFALILFGGGVAFASQVALAASVIAGLLAGMSMLIGLLMLTLYALLPIYAARTMGGADGLRISAQHLAIGLGMAVLMALGFGATEQGVSLQAFVGQMLEPFFGTLAAQEPTGMSAAAYAEVLDQLRQTVSGIFPGFVAFSLWLTWWGNVILARRIAVRYGFYSGGLQPVTCLRFGRQMAYSFAITLVIAGVAQGTLQYVASNAAIIMAGMLAVQGLAVAHLWLKNRRMQLMLVLMYLILMMQPAMVLPFTMIGLLDIWFDYRRGINPASGGS